MFFSVISVCPAEEPPVNEGVATLRAAVESYKAEDFTSAVSLFTKAYTLLPQTVSDHVLVNLADAALKNNDPAQALKWTGEYFARFDNPILRQQAMAIKAAALLGTNDPSAMEALGSYIHDYPADLEMRYKYAMALKGRGEAPWAEEHFLHIYIQGGELALKAYGELASTTIPKPMQLERAAKLYESGDFRAAEAILMELLKTSEPGDDRTRIKTLLADSLFRQSKYLDAAGYYAELDDLYNTARAYLRAGDEELFNVTMQEMISRGDEKVTRLIIATADDIRREGDSAGAIRLLEDNMGRFPSMREEALWRIGWTCYMDKQYERAAETFMKMAGEFKSAQYQYWYLRSIEKAGHEPDQSVIAGLLDGEDYYNMLARRLKDIPLIKDQAPIAAETASRLDFSKIDILYEGGLEEAASEELSALARDERAAENQLPLAFKFKEIRQYRKAMLQIIRVPESSRPVEILYPLAFWHVVSDVSGEYSLDPFLLLSLMREESRFDQMALSSAGAIGLMQLMPSTAQRTARLASVSLDNDKSIYTVENNIKLGTHYLNSLLDEFKNVPASLAAYNAGENRVRRWLKNGYASSDEFIEDIPYRETRNYVKRIIGTYFRYMQLGHPDFSGASLSML